MKTFAVLSALVGLTLAAPQAVTSAIAPAGTAPAGCKASYDGKFQVVVTTFGASKRDIVEKRQSQNLEVTLAGGVMTDSLGRTGYIASNNQFQFDGPAQAGAIYTAGWSVCANNSIALGSSTIFYQCLSGNFYNLYDKNTAAQCSPVELMAVLGTTTVAATIMPDGQVTGSAVPKTVICQIGDGQVQQNTCTRAIATITQIGDGQIQAPRVTQIADGQIQAPVKPTGATITQITDGQVQAPTSKPTGATITQITDGQVQAPKPTGAFVSQISDGQVQAPTGKNSTVTTATPTAPATTTSAAATTPAGQTGAAPTFRAELLGLAAGVVALVAFL